jgi:hypothetical protein
MSEGQGAEANEIPVDIRGTVGRGEAGDGGNVDSVEASERQDREDLKVIIKVPGACNLA